MRGAYVFSSERDVTDVAALVRRRRQYGDVAHEEPIRQSGGAAAGTYFYGVGGGAIVGTSGGSHTRNSYDLSNVLKAPAGKIIDGWAIVTSAVDLFGVNINGSQFGTFTGSLETHWADDPAKVALTFNPAWDGFRPGQSYSPFGWIYGDSTGSIFGPSQRILSLSATIPIFGNNQASESDREISFRWRADSFNNGTATINGIMAVFTIR